MDKAEYKYGIYGGITICIFKAIEFLSVFQKTRIENGFDTGLLALALVGVVVIAGIKSKRNNELKRYITFLQAFTTGVIIALTIALFAISFIFVYGKFINPNEAERMIEYVNISPGIDSPPSSNEIQEYYAPKHRSMETGENIIAVGFLVSLISAAMFRRVPLTEQDYIHEAQLPATVRRFFIGSVVFTILPFIIYILWLLKWADINTTLFEFLTDPIDPATNPLALQEGTAFMSLAAFVLNFISYNKIGNYGHRLNIWNLRMILISILSFLISTWLILHRVRFS